MSARRHFRHFTFGRFGLLAGAASLTALALFVSGPARANEFSSAISLPALAASEGAQFDGAGENDKVGSTIAGIGDINGDGIGDMLIASYRLGVDVTYSGTCYIVLGREIEFTSPVDLATPGQPGNFVIAGSNAERACYAADGAGDVNGDGLDDMLIGARNASPGGISYGGSAYVVYGKLGAFPSVLQLSALNGTDGFRIDGNISGGTLGVGVAGVGDINGDGYDDVAAGADGTDFFGSNSGSIYVVHGGSSLSSRISVSTLKGTTGFRLDGTAASDELGSVIDGAGDVNGDGFEDIVFGSDLIDPDSVNRAGSAYVLFGKSSKFSSAIAVSGLNGTTGFRINGAEADQRLSTSAAGAGDINGDGFDDIVMGAEYADYSGASSGSAFVVFGRSSGFASVMGVSSLDGSNGFRFDALAAADKLGSGKQSVDGGTDVNGDGYDDIVIGASNNDTGGTNAGVAFVVFGKRTAFNSAIAASTLNGNNGFRMTTSGAYGFLGRAVAGTGDVNGDGFGDVLVSALSATVGANDGAGSTFLLYGREPDSTVFRFGAAAAQKIRGGPFADFIWAEDGNDTLEGRGSGDILDGGPGTNTVTYANSNNGVTASLASPSSNTFDAEGDLYYFIHNLTGSRFSDTLTGDDGKNTIKGNADADIIKGKDGDDKLEGGLGADTMTGGTGKDTFVYRSTEESGPGAARDIILDFNPGESNSSHDKIDVSAIDAKEGTAGNQSFKYIGNKSFSDSKGELRIKEDGNDIKVLGDTDGDGSADIEILLDGEDRTSRFSEKDFKL